MTAPEDERNTYEPLGSGSFGSVTYRPGDIVGESYVLTSILAKGGMGVVFRARHLQLDKVFALKLLTPLQVTDANWRRFELEAKTLAKLEHKNVVQIFNMGVDARGCPYYVMELLHGQSMAEALEGGVPLSVPQFIQSFSDICSALKLAHGKGIVHRDIKPSNLILLDSNTAVKLTKVVDFGIARLLGVEGQNAQNLTLPGEIFGSPLYMSPEQTLGLPVTFASDIYSLGCTMFEAFTGSPPFKGPTALATMMMHQTDATPNISREDVSAREFDVIEQIIARCMEKKASQRFENVGDIFDLLDSLKTPGSSYSPPSSPRPSAAKSRVDDVPHNAKKYGTVELTGTDENTGRAAKNTKSTVYAIALALVIGLGTMGALYLILMQPNKVKVVALSNSALVRQITGEPGLPAFENVRKKPLLLAHRTSRISRLVSGNGRTWREFLFPTEVQVGAVWIGDTKVLAVGKVVCPNDQPVPFDATDALAEVPQFYTLFDDRALSSLLVKGSNKPPTIATLAGWKSLNNLAFENCQLGKPYLKGLGKLRHLKILSFYFCNVSAKSLVDSGVLSRLSGLHLAAEDDAADILKAIEGSKTLTRLSLRRNTLDEREVASIATLSQLTVLDLRHSKLPMPSMEIIARMPNLKTLFLNKAKFKVATLVALLKSDSLRRVDVESIELPQGLLAQMKAARPSLIIEEVQN